MIINTYKQESLLEGTIYDSDLGFHQIGLDLMREEAELFEMYTKHDIAELSIVNESEIAILNEASVKEIVQKFIGVVKAFIQKIQAAFNAFMDKIKAISLKIKANLAAKKKSSSNTDLNKKITYTVTIIEDDDFNKIYSAMDYITNEINKITSDINNDQIKDIYDGSSLKDEILKICGGGESISWIINGYVKEREFSHTIEEIFSASNAFITKQSGISSRNKSITKSLETFNNNLETYIKSVLKNNTELEYGRKCTQLINYTGTLMKTTTDIHTSTYNASMRCIESYTKVIQNIKL